MKKLLCIALTLAMLLSLVLCIPAFAFTADNDTHSGYYMQESEIIDSDSTIRLKYKIFSLQDDEDVFLSDLSLNPQDVSASLSAASHTPATAVGIFMHANDVPPQGLAVKVDITDISEFNNLSGQTDVKLLHGKVTAYEQDTYTFQESAWTWEPIAYAITTENNRTYLTFTATSFSPFVFVTNNGAGGNTPGGNTPGGNTPGGNTPGGNTPGGNTPGGNTPGGNTPTNPDGGNGGNTPTNPNDGNGGPGVPDDGANREPNAIPYVPTPNPNAPSFNQNNGAPAVNDANPNTGAAFALLPILPLTIAGGVVALVSRKKK